MPSPKGDSQRRSPRNIFHCWVRPEQPGWVISRSNPRVPNTTGVSPIENKEGHFSYPSKTVRIFFIVRSPASFDIAEDLVIKLSHMGKVKTQSKNPINERLISSIFLLPYLSLGIGFHLGSIYPKENALLAFLWPLCSGRASGGAVPQGAELLDPELH